MSHHIPRNVSSSNQMISHSQDRHRDPPLKKPNKKYVSNSRSEGMKQVPFVVTYGDNSDEEDTTSFEHEDFLKTSEDRNG